MMWNICISAFFGQSRGGPRQKVSGKNTAAAGEDDFFRNRKAQTLQPGEKHAAKFALKKQMSDVPFVPRPFTGDIGRIQARPSVQKISLAGITNVWPQ